VAADQAQLGEVAAQQVRRAVGDVLVVDAVEAEAPQSGVEPLVRPGVGVRRGRQVRMEGGVEDRDLRHVVAEHALDRLHAATSHSATPA
jgi:hypothetical protein